MSSSPTLLWNLLGQSYFGLLNKVRRKFCNIQHKFSRTLVGWGSRHLCSCAPRVRWLAGTDMTRCTGNDEKYVDRVFAVTGLTFKFRPGQDRQPGLLPPIWSDWTDGTWHLYGTRVFVSIKNEGIELIESNRDPCILMAITQAHTLSYLDSCVLTTWCSRSACLSARRGWRLGARACCSWWSRGSCGRLPPGPRYAPCRAGYHHNIWNKSRR